MISRPAVRSLVEVQNRIVGVAGQQRPVVALVQPAKFAAQLIERQAWQQRAGGDRRAGAGDRDWACGSCGRLRGRGFLLRSALERAPPRPPTHACIGSALRSRAAQQKRSLEHARARSARAAGRARAVRPPHRVRSAARATTRTRRRSPREAPRACSRSRRRPSRSGRRRRSRWPRASAPAPAKKSRTAVGRSGAAPAIASYSARKKRPPVRSTSSASCSFPPGKKWYSEPNGASGLGGDLLQAGAGVALAPEQLGARVEDALAGRDLVAGGRVGGRVGGAGHLPSRPPPYHE